MPKGDFTFFSHDPLDAPGGYDPRDPSKSFGVQTWNIEGRRIPSTVQPQPTLKNPGRYWTQDEDNVWREVDVNDFPESEQHLSDIAKDLAGPTMTEAEQRRLIEQMAPRISEILGRHLSGQQ